ncbi:hypothetical protein EDD85DRAFT_849193 [Armillaria nabsnona]|nr:hypothetical protein EDD85DRAFT_849193 [Armillaria nabsnona]
MSKGSIRWLAPEYIDPKAVIDQGYITARDIYAYGCTVIEIFTGKPPFSDIKNEAAVIHMVMAGKFLPRPQHLLQDGLWSLVMACLTASPSQWPIAEQIPKVLVAEIKLFQESMMEGSITMYVLSQIADSGYTSKSPLTGIANGGTDPSDPDHSNPITLDNQKKSEFLDMDEDEEEEVTNERDTYNTMEPGNLGPTLVQSTSLMLPHGRKIKPQAAAEDFPLPSSNTNLQKQAQAIA